MKLYSHCNSALNYVNLSLHPPMGRAQETTQGAVGDAEALQDPIKPMHKG